MTKPRPLAPLNAQIRAEAVEWLLRFSEGEVNAPAREEFNYWLRTSPEHVRAYLRISAFWQEAESIDGLSRDPSKEDPARVGQGASARNIEALIARAKLEANVYPLELGSSTQRKPKRNLRITLRPASPGV